jgi:hypothetical protein
LDYLQELYCDFGQGLLGFYDFVGGIFVVSQAALMIFIIGSQIEMAVSAQVEKDNS